MIHEERLHRKSPRPRPPTQTSMHVMTDSRNYSPELTHSRFLPLSFENNDTSSCFEVVQLHLYAIAAAQPGFKFCFVSSRKVSVCSVQQCFPLTVFVTCSPSFCPVMPLFGIFDHDRRVIDFCSQCII